MARMTRPLTREKKERSHQMVRKARNVQRMLWMVTLMMVTIEDIGMAVSPKMMCALAHVWHTGAVVAERYQSHRHAVERRRRKYGVMLKRILVTMKGINGSTVVKTVVEAISKWLLGVAPKDRVCRELCRQRRLAVSRWYKG